MTGASSAASQLRADGSTTVNETLNLILRMPERATYLAQSRSQVSPVVIPLLMEHLESAEKNGDTARAGHLREVYYEVTLK